MPSPRRPGNFVARGYTRCLFRPEDGERPAWGGGEGGWMDGWLVGWMVGWLVGWLVG
ncbi:unnamed protein product [Diplocarpon coronariae]